MSYFKICVRRVMIAIVSTIGCVITAAPVAAQHAHAAPASSPDDSAAVSAVIEQYHAALAAGDSTAALQLLAPDAIILESGGMETRDEYRSHHLPGDIAFASAVESERRPVALKVAGDMAWAASTSRTQGTLRERTINSAGTELVVLTRTAEGWRISAIHWSSRNVRN